MLVTTSLTDCRLGNLIDVVTVIDVDDDAIETCKEEAVWFEFCR